MAEKLSINNNIIGTTADRVEYGKTGWPEATNLKAAIDNLHRRLTDVELHGGGGSDIIQVNGTWVSFGDSITALDAHDSTHYGIASNYVTKGYQTRVREKLAFSNFYNYSYSGNISAHSLTRVNEMIEDNIVPDYVTWLYGTNDTINGGTGWKGTLQDYINKTSTFAGSVRKFVDAIKEVNPNVKIILCTIPKRIIRTNSANYPHWYVPEQGTRGYYQAEWADLVLQIANYENRIDAVCDLFNLPNSNESTWYDENDPTAGFTYDGTHPNDRGMQGIADMMIDVFKKIL